MDEARSEETEPRRKKERKRRWNRARVLTCVWCPNLGVRFDVRADPFKDVEGEEKKDASNQEYVHIRVQQRNGRKSITTVQGLQKGFDYKKVLKAFKKEFCCNGSVVEDKEHGQVIQLQGDQRKNVSHFLVEEGICKADLLKIHGF